MKILNLGSLNFDKVYDVPHFVTEGESMMGLGYAEFLGGKGLNQSLALARAGAEVYHLGAVGPEGSALCACLDQSGVNTKYLHSVETVSGHAIIQKCNGLNCIIVFGGANQCVSEQMILDAMEGFEAGDILLLQNETSNVSFAIEQAKKRGMKVAFNASPITDGLLSYPLGLVDYFIINETEGKALSGCTSDDFDTILSSLTSRFPGATIVLTVGSQGVLYQDQNIKTEHKCYKVKVADTTAAGDTFCGYYLAALCEGKSVSECLRIASLAGALAVSKNGASTSIPTRQEVEAFGANKD